MTRKEILVFQLHELRHELRDAVRGLADDQLFANAHPALNPIGWYAVHCMHNWDFFIHSAQTGEALLAEEGERRRTESYGYVPMTALETSSGMTGARVREILGEVSGKCIDLIENLD